MLRDGMENWMIALFILAAVAIGGLGAGWSQWLEHRRRSQAMEVIKAAIEAGREPPQILYEQLGKSERETKAPWTEALLFGALGVGFWIAYFNASEAREASYLVIASTMSVTSLGCLALAILRPGQSSRKDDERS